MNCQIPGGILELSKNSDHAGVISIVIGPKGEVMSSLKENVEQKISQNISFGSSMLHLSEAEEKDDIAEPLPILQDVKPKRKRGRPRKTGKEITPPSPPPLMIHERAKRKRSAKFNTFLEVLRGEKEFYIEEEKDEKEKPKSGRGRKKKKKTESPYGEQQMVPDGGHQLVVGQEWTRSNLTALGNSGSQNELQVKPEFRTVGNVSQAIGTNVASQDRDRDGIDLEEVVHEILGLKIECIKEEPEFIHEIEDLENSHHLLIKEISNMDTSSPFPLECDKDKVYENKSEMSGPVKAEPFCIDVLEKVQLPHVSQYQEEESPTHTVPSIEVREGDNDTSTCASSIEMTITKSDNDTLHAVINDQMIINSVCPLTTVEAEGSERGIESSKKFRCRECGYIFDNRETAQAHARTHHSDKVQGIERPLDSKKGGFKCSKCEKEFPTARGRDKHHLDMHLKNKPVQCSECHQTFNSFRVLERHMKIIHDQDPLLHCDLCEAEFVLSLSLAHHTEIMHPVVPRNKKSRVIAPAQEKSGKGVGRKRLKVQECPICHEKIYGLRALSAHNQKEHGGQDYTCKLCKFKTNSMATLNRHMAMVHNALDINIYVCIKCRAQFKEARDLEEHHIQAHGKELTFHCNYCGQKFACREMYRFHRNTHRAFSCDICHLGFMKEESLEEHIASVHSEVQIGKQKENLSELQESLKENQQLNNVSKIKKKGAGTKEGDRNIASSKVLEICPDGLVSIKEDPPAVVEPEPLSNGVTLHLLGTNDGGLAEMDLSNPLKGLKIRDLPKKIKCPVCEKVLTTKFMRTHMLSHKGNLPHKCHVCSKSYAQGTLLRKHMKNRHYEEYLKLGNKNPKKHKVKCDFCPETYDDILQLEEHLWKHMEEKYYECSDCKIKFGMESNLQKHLKSHYFKEERPCPICEREFKSIGYYNEHVARCKSGWKCELCNLICETREYYRKHQRAEHGGENVVRYQCNACEKSFLEKHRYDDHMITHSSEKAFACPICEKQFKRMRPLNVHLLRAHSDQSQKHICSYCKNVFNSVAELERHKSIHKRECPCQACGHVYSTKAALQNHLAVHHNNGSTPLYGCPVCDLRFAKEYNLKAHIAVHNVESLYDCPYDECSKSFKSESLLKTHLQRRHGQGVSLSCSSCDKSFFSEYELRRHEATHNNGSFECPDCPKVFRHEMQLQKHMLTHTDEQPYECAICNATFNSRNAVVRHLQSQHGLAEQDSRFHIRISKWRCSECCKMFIVRAALVRHLQDHALHGLVAEGHAVKTKTSLTLTVEPGTESVVSEGDPGVVDQEVILGWQQLAPLLRLQVLAQVSNGEGNGEVSETATPLATNVWQCPSCLAVTDAEEAMREHLTESVECHDALILQLAGGDTGPLLRAVEGSGLQLDGASVEDNSGSLEDGGLPVNKTTEQTVPLEGIDEEVQFVIVQEPTQFEALGSASNEDITVPTSASQPTQENDQVQVLVSVEDEIQQLLHQSAQVGDQSNEIEIVVPTEINLEDLLKKGGLQMEEGDLNGSPLGNQLHNSESRVPSDKTNTPTTVVMASQERVMEEVERQMELTDGGTTVLNGLEVLLQTPDGHFVLQQTVNGETKYQLVEGMATSEPLVDSVEQANTIIPTASGDSLPDAELLLQG
ncbi:uncharacterized protein LOC143036875 [Oratosquilla oratoria]|uniref:uncharacterized protein LOC143036875 n=1 Tax=Oratosquilla oratoria TaxID=337810 RepID=UPI003F76F2CB